MDLDSLLHPLSDAPGMSLLSLVALAACSLTFAAYAISIFYRSPIARYPGPKAAALSRYWQAFVKLVRGRSFVLELEELHKKHGK